VRPAPPTSHPERWRIIAGPALTALLALALVLAERCGLRVQNPVLFFALAIVGAGYLGGTGSALCSVAVCFGFTLWSWAVPGQPFRYAPVDQQRLAVQAITMPAMAVLVGTLRRRDAERLAALTAALHQVRELEGLIRICSYCKRVRSDDGMWDRIEAYLGRHTRAQFTHGICPDCDARLEREDRERPAG
jgi:hypothetical protein